jgi:hypothetical protein
MNEKSKWKIGRNLFLINLRNDDGSRNLDDAHLAELFELTRRDEKLETVFYDGSVKNLQDFIRFAENPDRRFYAGYIGRPGALAPAGFVWLDRFAGRSAYVHFNIFPNVPRRDLIALARAVLWAALFAQDPTGRRYLKTLRAAVPQTNRMAIKFMEKIGFVILGPVPDAAYLARENRSVPLIEAYIT